MELRWKFWVRVRPLNLERAAVIWDSHTMLNLPMVAQSPYYIRIYIHILYIVPLSPLLSDGVIYDLSVLIHSSSSNK